MTLKLLQPVILLLLQILTALFVVWSHSFWFIKDCLSSQFLNSNSYECCKKKSVVFSIILSCSAFICMEKNHSMSSVLCYLSSIHKCCPRMWRYIHRSLLFLSTRKIKYYMKLRKQLASRTLSSATKKSIPLYKKFFLKIYIYIFFISERWRKVYIIWNVLFWL